jgi:predicted small secreted protein
VEEHAVKHPHMTPRARLCFALAVIAAMALNLAGCNTVSGAGEDTSNAGTAISNTAQSVQQ